MNLSLVFDGMFAVAFAGGLLLAVLLPLLGMYVRLRDEWLAALGLAQAAAAGTVLGAMLLGPVAVVALLAAALAALGKALFGRAGNDAYGYMILLGWGVALLGAANATHGAELARALTEGQLYFTGWTHLGGIAAVTTVAAIALPWLSPRLLALRFFPDLARANGRPAPRSGIAFDVLVACALAVATASVGVMAAFALVFVPPWIAFRLGHGWRRAVAWAIGVSVAAYVVAFAAAIALDQPFGPVLVVVLAAAAALRMLPRAR